MEANCMCNGVMLITYPDSLGGDLPNLRKALCRHFSGALAGVHVLPFYPSSADRGFAPLEYRKVEEAFGSYEDIRSLGQSHCLMVDYMVNHISAQSVFYQDFLQNKDASAWKDLFIRYRDFWPKGEPTPEQVALIYKRKPRAPYVTAHFADGSNEKVWCTFGEEQIDLNALSATTHRFNQENLAFLAQNKASFIRLDAFAYATKKQDTNCFFVEPEVWQMLEEYQNDVAPFGVQILPEIHEHYTIQLKLAEKGYWVYDFALPMLVLHAIYAGRSDRLAHWLNICPRKQFTTLDTHDGIGVVDVKDLLSDEEIEFTRDTLYARGANVKPKYSTAEYNNLDIYQINCTYYSALGNDDEAYLLARAIQFFAPGIPMVYYVGLLAGENDIDLLEETREGRNINRHSYTPDEIELDVQRPVVKRLLALARFRNIHPAFQGRPQVLPRQHVAELALHWENGDEWAQLNANLENKSISIRYSTAGKEEIFHFDEWCERTITRKSNSIVSSQ